MGVCDQPAKRDTDKWMAEFNVTKDDFNKVYLGYHPTKDTVLWTLVGCCKTCGITVEDVDGNDTKSIDFASYNPKCGLCRIEPFDPILVMTHKKTTITAVYRNKDGKIDKTKTLQAYDD